MILITEGENPGNTTDRPRHLALCPKGILCMEYGKKCLSDLNLNMQQTCTHHSVHTWSKVLMSGSIV